jgi:hypothetical protein
VKVEDEIQLTDLACPHHTNSNMMQQSQDLAKTQDFYSMKKLIINSIFTFSGLWRASQFTTLRRLEVISSSELLS